MPLFSSCKNFLIATESAYYFELRSVINGNIVSQIVADCEMVSAVQFELFPFQLIEKLPQSIRFLIFKLLSTCDLYHPLSVGGPDELVPMT
jgi:hypothetical protein